MTSGRVVLDFGSSSSSSSTANQLSIPLMEGSSLCVYHSTCHMSRNPITQQVRYHGGQVLHIGREFHAEDRITLSHPRNDVSFHLDIICFIGDQQQQQQQQRNNNSNTIDEKGL